ncbi:MAG: DUF2065 domain-containing protein [Steroidobacteraceae bacterium]
MDINWGDLLAALGIVFVIEGIMPFLNPCGARRTLAKIAELGDRELRLGGLFSMLGGLVLLFFAR